MGSVVGWLPRLGLDIFPFRWPRLVAVWLGVLVVLVTARGFAVKRPMRLSYFDGLNVELSCIVYSRVAVLVNDVWRSSVVTGVANLRSRSSD